MSSSVKSGLVTSLGLFIISFVSGLICQLCGPFAAIIAGGLAGFLSQNWGEVDLLASPAQQGAIAGVIAGAGGLLGQLFSAAANAFLVGSGVVANPVEDFLGPIGTSDLVLGVAVWGCVGLVDLVLSAGAGALAGHFGRKSDVTA